MHFLLLWATGDSCNLIACLLTGDQTPIQIYTAVYFLMSDSVLISQFVLYSKRQLRRRRGLNIGGEMMRDVGVQPNSSSPIANEVMSMIDENISTIHDEDKGNNDSCGDDVHPPSTPKHRNQKKNKKKKPVSPSTYISGFLGAGVSVYSFRSFSSSGTMNSMSGATRTLQSATGCLNHAISKTSKTRVVFGRFIGYASATCYLGGRVFQILKNRRRKSCEGVSMLMFFFAISANVTYGISIIFMKNFRWDEIVHSLSFLCGSFGTCGLDMYILMQSRYYRTLGTDTSTHTSGSAGRTSDEREASVHLLSQEAVEDV